MRKIDITMLSIKGSISIVRSLNIFNKFFISGYTLTMLLIYITTIPNDYIIVLLATLVFFIGSFCFLFVLDIVICLCEGEA